MSGNFVFILFASVFVPATWGHLCLINPHQRGSMIQLNQKGSHDCFLIKGPCGGRAMSKSLVYFTSGMNYTITFQKNLDHWTEATPGYFSIKLWTPAVKLVKELARVPDNGEPSLHIYNAAVNFPKMNPDHSLMNNKDGATVHIYQNDNLKRRVETFILQVTYVTNNPQAPKAFYQCADIGIMM